jgi:glutamate carboxypeptidase
MHEKSSAILELAHRIVALEALNATLPGVSLNVGRVEGGLGPATVPAHASAAIDVRWEDQSHHALLLAKIGEMLSHNEQSGCRSELTVLNQRPAMPLRNGSERLCALIEGVAAELGQMVGRQHRRGTSDANFFGSAGVPTVDGLGPVSDRYHTAEEYIVVDSLKQRTALLAGVLAAMGENLDAFAER